MTDQARSSAPALRFHYAKAAEGGYRAMLGLESFLHSCGLEAGLIHLLKLRVSQINGCAFCIDMHWKDLRALGEPEQRLYSLDAWHESPFYSDRERAALAWAEAVTSLADGHVPDEVYRQVCTQFDEAGGREPDVRRGDDQRVEPARDRVAHAARQLPAQEVDP